MYIYTCAQPGSVLHWALALSSSICSVHILRHLAHCLAYFLRVSENIAYIECKFEWFTTGASVKNEETNQKIKQNKEKESENNKEKEGDKLHETAEICHTCVACEMDFLDALATNHKSTSNWWEFSVVFSFPPSLFLPIYLSLFFYLYSDGGEQLGAVAGHC